MESITLTNWISGCLLNAIDGEIMTHDEEVVDLKKEKLPEKLFEEHSPGSKTVISQTIKSGTESVRFTSRTVITDATAEAEPTINIDDENKIEIVYEAKKGRSKNPAVEWEPYRPKDNSHIPVEIQKFDKMLYPDAVFLYERVLLNRRRKKMVEADQEPLWGTLYSSPEESALDYRDIKTEDVNNLTPEQYKALEAMEKEWQAENEWAENNKLHGNQKIVNETPENMGESHSWYSELKILANEPAKPSKMHLTYYADLYRKRIANETPELRQKSLASWAERHPKITDSETPEQREKRFFSAAESYRRRMARETPEKRLKRLEHSAERRKLRMRKLQCSAEAEKKLQAIEEETSEEREKRNAFYEEMYRKMKAKEIPAQAMKNRAHYAERHYRKLIASETAEEREKRLLRDEEKRKSLRTREVKK